MPQSAAELTELLGEQYATFNDVSGWANLALDIGAMRDAPNAQDVQAIYENVGLSSHLILTTTNVKKDCLAHNCATMIL